MTQDRRRKTRGFTIVEMLTVFFVILVIAGLLLPALRGAFATGREAKSIARLRQIVLRRAVDLSLEEHSVALVAQLDHIGRQRRTKSVNERRPGHAIDIL